MLFLALQTATAASLNCAPLLYESGNQHQHNQRHSACAFPLNTTVLPIYHENNNHMITCGTECKKRCYNHTRAVVSRTERLCAELIANQYHHGYQSQSLRGWRQQPQQTCSAPCPVAINRRFYRQKNAKSPTGGVRIKCETPARAGVSQKIKQLR